MARVPLLNPEDVPEQAEFVDRVLSGRRGRLINVYRTLLHSPPLAESWLEPDCGREPLLPGPLP